MLAEIVQTRSNFILCSNPNKAHSGGEEGSFVRIRFDSNGNSFVQINGMKEEEE